MMWYISGSVCKMLDTHKVSLTFIFLVAPKGDKVGKM